MPFHFHWSELLAGGTAVGILAHAVNSFPTPENPYARWLLGVIQYTVGQRVAATNTLKGQDSTIIATPIAERPQTKP